MARQKKESPNSILRRVVDRTPLRPAILRNFGPAATTGPAQFAARYFERNSSLIQRYLNLGGENSPLHQPISLNIVARFTSFNQSFGPIQRALRPQLEHAPRRRPQVAESAADEVAYAEEPGSFDYAPTPAYFNEPPVTQPTFGSYDAARPALAPWEAPLNTTPLAVARRIDFQPANLRYINSPERRFQSPSRPTPPPEVARTVQPAVPFAASPVPVVPAPVPQRPPAAQQVAAPVNLPQPGEAVERTSSVQPASEAAAPTPPNYTLPDSPAAPVGFATPASPANFVLPASPTQPADVRPAVARTTDGFDYAAPALPDSADLGYAVEPAPVYRPVTQPALSRAIQRAAEATNIESNTAASLGASPAAIARRYISPVTMARYQTLKQTTDRVLGGEQPSSIEATGPINSFELARTSEAARYFEPRYVPQRQLNPAVARQRAEAQARREAQRLAEETGTYQAAPQLDAEVRQPAAENPVQPYSPEIRQPGQFSEAPEAARPAAIPPIARFVEQPAAQPATRPADVQQPGPVPAATAPGQSPLSAQDNSQDAAQEAWPLTERPTERPTTQQAEQPAAPSAEPGINRLAEQPAEQTGARPTTLSIQQLPAGFEAIEAPAAPAPGQPTAPAGRNRETPAVEPVFQASEPVVRRVSQPSESVEYDYSPAEAALDPFEGAIPASLLDNEAFSDEALQTGTLPEVQRLTGHRLQMPLKTTLWANTLPTLRNNPGIAAGPANIARQLENSAAPEIDNWSAGSGAGVYIPQRRVRRKQAAAEAAAETQDRIFSLAETPASVTDFQPQLMRAMALEEVAAPLPPARVQPAAPLITPAYVPQPSTRQPGSINPAPGISRTFEPAVSNTDFAAQPPQSLQADGQPLETRPTPAAPLSPLQSPINPVAPAGGQATPAIQRVTPERTTDATFAADVPFESLAQPETMPGFTAQPFEAATPAAFASDVPQAFTVDGQPVGYPQTAAPGGQFRAAQRLLRARGLQPTALQRVFKRMDLETPASSGPAENADLGFGIMPRSYVAQPGLRRNRVKPLDLAATATEQPYFEDSYNEIAPADYAAQPVAPVSPVARVYREQVAERPVARPQAAPQTAPTQALPFAQFSPAPAPVSEDGAAQVAPPFQAPASPAQAASPAGFEAGPVAPGGEFRAIQRVPVEPGQGAGPSQPQYFRNSLEASWLSPENRLFIERLPGGSSALQRLFQAPRSSFEPSSFAAGVDLPTLRNNPGLASQVARVLEESGAFSPNSGWPASFPLRYVPQRRTGRPAQVVRQLESEAAALPAESADFEGAWAVENETLSGGIIPTRPEAVQRAFVTPPERVRPTQPGATTQPAIVSTGQPGISQAGMNRETATRIQRNLAGKIETAQPGSSAAASEAPAVPSFTISGNWLAQLESRYQGYSTSQLNGPSSLVMRLMTADGKPNPGLTSFAGVDAANNFAAFNKPSLNYITPPLLWQKVSKYAPENGMAAYDQMAAGPAQVQGPGYTPPGEVLRAFDRQDPVYSRAEEKLAPSERTSESVAAAQLILPRLRQTHSTLQRINSIETNNASLELAHKVDVAAFADDSATPLSGQYGSSSPLPFNLPRLAEPSVARGVNEPAGRSAAAEAAPPIPMADAPTKRPALPRFLTVDAEVLADAAEVRAEPQPRPITAPDKPIYRTPLEAAVARHSAEGPNIGQGQVLQPLAIQRKAATPTQPATYAPLAQPILHSVIKTSVGRSLEHTVQRRMSNIFGSKFDNVRVHTGDEAAQATKHVGAEAFTLGSNIYFAPGRYQPETQVGRALIGHELTHVIQQSSLPSLGHGRIPETSSHGQTLEHHAIANEQLLMRHLASPGGSDDDHHDHNHDFEDHAYEEPKPAFSAGIDGRLSFSPVNSSQPVSAAIATIERSYEPVANNFNHPPLRPTHLRHDSGASSSIQRALTPDEVASSGTDVSSGDVSEIIAEQERMEELARKVYQIIRDELLIERERGFGPSNKFF